MPKAVRLASTIPATFVPSKSVTSQSDSNQLVSIALFSGIGLLISLVALFSGVQGAWF
jgi:hypothetical protein